MGDSLDSESRDRVGRVFDSLERLHGGLVELYVFDAGVEDWARVVEHLESDGRISSFTRDGQEIERAISPTVFDDQDFDPYRLVVHVVDTTWTTSLVDPDTVDLQGDPREFVEATQVQGLLDFLDKLAKLLGKEVLLIPESADPRAVKPLARAAPG